MPFNGHRLRRGRFSEFGRAYFLTACCLGRRKVFLDRRYAGIVAAEFARQERAEPCRTLAWVVMPDHVHWLVEPRAALELGTLVGRFKGRTAYLVNLARGCRGVLWQKGFHDHAVRDEEDLERAAEYLIHNPVRAGPVQSIDAYPYWDSIWHSRSTRRRQERLQARLPSRPDKRNRG